MDSTMILETLTETILYAFQFIVLLIGGGSLLFLLFCLGCAGSDCFATPKRRTRQQLDIRHRESMLRESFSIFTLKLKREPQSVQRRTVS